MKNSRVLEFFRGDFYSKTFVFKDRVTQQVLDLTDYSFTLTVSSNVNPPDEVDKLFSVAGVVTEPLLGKVVFNFLQEHTNIPPKEYFYDIEMSKSTNYKRTIYKDKFIIYQDITK